MVLSIILYPYRYAKSKLRDLLSEIDLEYNISKKLAYLYSLTLWILGCYLASILLYFIFYNLYIPTVHQTSRLAFTKTDFGSTARIYNSRDDFPLCQNPLVINRTSQAIVQSTPSPQNKICKNPVNLGTSIEFVNQDYSIKIQLDLNEQVQKPEDNVLVSSFEVINKNNEVLEVTREGLTNIPTETYTIAQMMDMMKKGVGVGENSHQTEVVLSEKFANGAFGIHVININLPKNQAFITKGTIKVEAILSGLGRFMYYWFWSSAVFFVNFICISVIFGTIYGRQFGERVFLVGKIYLNNILEFVNNLQMFFVNKKLELAGYYRRKVQKQRERVDKIAAYKKRIMEYSQRVIDIQKEKATGICSRRKKKIVADVNKLD